MKVVHKRNLAGLISLLFILTGVLLAYRGDKIIPSANNSNQSELPKIRRELSNPQWQSNLFKVKKDERFVFTESDEDLFSLRLISYLDHDNNSHSVILFPKSLADDVTFVSTSGTDLRQKIWMDTADVIEKKAPENALFLSWWDDGQRIHFLTGRNSWFNNPPSENVRSHYWQVLRNEMPKATDSELKRMKQLARWLTMDAEQAVSEMRDSFEVSHPVYLLVNNDILMHLPEIYALSQQSLNLAYKTLPAGENLHGDIARVKRWAQENGNGNYLVQREGNRYRVWVTSDAISQQSLLVRLLPFVDSLVKLPEHIHTVFQSHWGAFQTIYQLELN